MSDSLAVDAKEVLTNGKGEFHIPSHTFFSLWPFASGESTEFIIYKSGYGNFPDLQIVPSGLTPGDEQTFFSREIGSEGELEMWAKEKDGLHLRRSKVSFGIVELPKLKIKEERLKAIPSTPTDIRAKELPLLYKMMNEENKRFGLGEVR